MSGSNEGMCLVMCYLHVSDSQYMCACLYAPG